MKGTIGPVNDIVMNIIQTPDGNINGDWSGVLAPPSIDCTALNVAAGTVNGSYTVVGIGLTISDVGFFHGQKISPTQFRGSFQSCGHFYNATFTLANPTPGS